MLSHTIQKRQPITAAASRAADIATFLLAWLRDPRGVAAVAPSGRALAALITREIDSATGPVLELGPGTGAFTQALLDRGVSEYNLTLLEYGAGFVQLLRRRFSGARVVEMDAANLADLSPADSAPYGAVVCGLGLLNMREPMVEAILRGAFARMRRDAPFFLFTYGGGCSIPTGVLARLGLVSTRVGGTWLNIPPASVYRLTRTSRKGR